MVAVFGVARIFPSFIPYINRNVEDFSWSWWKYSKHSRYKEYVVNIYKKKKTNGDVLLDFQIALSSNLLNIVFIWANISGGHRCVVWGPMRPTLHPSQNVIKVKHYISKYDLTGKNTLNHYENHYCSLPPQIKNRGCSHLLWKSMRILLHLWLTWRVALVIV